jgi:hypothetical protein
MLAQKLLHRNLNLEEYLKTWVPITWWFLNPYRQLLQTQQTVWWITRRGVYFRRILPIWSLHLPLKTAPSPKISLIINLNRRKPRSHHHIINSMLRIILIYETMIKAIIVYKITLAVQKKSISWIRFRRRWKMNKNLRQLSTSLWTCGFHHRTSATLVRPRSWKFFHHILHTKTNYKSSIKIRFIQI